MGTGVAIPPPICLTEDHAKTIRRRPKIVRRHVPGYAPPEIASARARARHQERRPDPAAMAPVHLRSRGSRSPRPHRRLPEAAEKPNRAAKAKASRVIARQGLGRAV